MKSLRNTGPVPVNTLPHHVHIVLCLHAAILTSFRRFARESDSKSRALVRLGGTHPLSHGEGVFLYWKCGNPHQVSVLMHILRPFVAQYPDDAMLLKSCPGSTEHLGRYNPDGFRPHYTTTIVSRPLTLDA